MHLRKALSAPRRLPGPDWLPAACAFAAVAALFLLLAWRIWLLRDGLPLLDWESTERLFLAQSWAQSPFFGNDRRWLPLYFALNGTFLRVVSQPLLAHVLLNTLLSLGGLLAYWGVLGRINPGRRMENLVLVALGGLSLYSVENAVFPRSAALFTCCVLSGMFFHLRRLETESPLDQALAVFFIAAAAMTRYEGWAFALCLLALGLRRPRPWMNLLVLLPIAAWIGFGGRAGDGPLFFLPDLSNFAHRTTPGLNTGRLEELVTNVILGAPARLDLQMVVPIPLLSLLGACGALLLLGTGAAARHFLLLAGLPTAALAALMVACHYPAPAEHMALLQMLFLACLAPVLDRLLVPLRLSAAAVAFAACASASLRIGLHDQPLLYESGPQSRRVAAVVQELSRDSLAQGDAVLTEVRAFCPEREVCEEPVLLRALAYPRRVLFDRPDLSYRPAPGGSRLPDQPSLFDAPDRELRSRLREEKVRLIVLRSPHLVKTLAPEWQPAGAWGPYRLLLRRGDRLLPGLATRLCTMARAYPGEAS